MAETELWEVLMGPGRTERLTLEQLDAAFEAETISAGTLIRELGSADWRPLYEVAGLEPPPVPPPAPPPKSRPVSQLPPVAAAPSSPPSAEKRSRPPALPPRRSGPPSKRTAKGVPLPSIPPRDEDAGPLNPKPLTPPRASSRRVSAPPSAATGGTRSRRAPSILSAPAPSPMEPPEAREPREPSRAPANSSRAPANKRAATASVAPPVAPEARARAAGNQPSVPPPLAPAPHFPPPGDPPAPLSHSAAPVGQSLESAHLQPLPVMAVGGGRQDLAVAPQAPESPAVSRNPTENTRGVSTPQGWLPGAPPLPNNAFAHLEAPPVPVPGGWPEAANAPLSAHSAPSVMEPPNPWAAESPPAAGAPPAAYTPHIFAIGEAQDTTQGLVLEERPSTNPGRSLSRLEVTFWAIASLLALLVILHRNGTLRDWFDARGYGLMEVQLLGKPSIDTVQGVKAFLVETQSARASQSSEED